MIIKRRQQLTGEVGTVISMMKINILQYLIVDRIGRIINNVRGETKEKMIEFIEKY